MRRTIFLVTSFLVVAVLATVFPSSLVAAKLASPPETAVTAPVQQEAEKALVEDILYELNLAKGMTDDENILAQIDAIIDMVRKLMWLEFTGQTEAALRLKHIIAESLERLINELPLASAGMTTALAAMPESNPVYEELVRVRAKIERLIVMETPPAEITPLEPVIPLLPETERYVVYSAKFLCGPAFGREGVQRGSYSTAINVHNPHEGTVYLYKKAVIANREDEPRGKISPFHRVALGPDEAIEIDCIDIGVLLGSDEEDTGVTTIPEQNLSSLDAPTIDTSNITPVSSLVRFVKGFVVIYASASLDVVGVYTASTPVGFSLDVEYIDRSTTATIPTTEQTRCPDGCLCLTKRAAEESGYTALCGGEVKICGYDDQQNPLYCFEKPGIIRCPEGCVCMSVPEAEEHGYSRCPQETRSCGYDAAGNAMYCYLKPTDEECPDGCACLTETEAKRLGYDLCNGQVEVCGYDAQQNRKLCYELPTFDEECPDGCSCLTKAEAERLGYDLCNGQEIICGYDANQNPKLCYEAPSEAECPQGCVCLTAAVARERGYDLCNNQQILCGYDSAGNALYCYEEPAGEECPQGCFCLTEADAKKLGYEFCLGQKVLCGYNTAGVAMYCYQEPAEEELECPQGCFCLTAAEAEKMGYSLCNGQRVICGYDAAGNALYCYEAPAEEDCPQGCTCLTPLEARKLGYVLCGNEWIPCDYAPGAAQKWCYQPAD